MTVLKWLGLLLVLLAAALSGALIYGNARWNQMTRELNARLDAARSAPSPGSYDEARELEGLPAPVQRFFRTVLRDGAPMIAAVTVQHSGTFNMSDSGGEQWQPFTSTQRVVTRRPGFVWDGRVNVLPGLAVHVHDAYVAGEGMLHPAIAGLFTLADLHDRAAAEPGRELAGGGRHVGTRHSDRWRDYPDIDLSFRCRRQRCIGPRRSPRPHRARQGAPNAVGRPVEQPRRAQRHARAVHWRGGVAHR
jgi:hypothetical protein